MATSSGDTRNATVEAHGVDTIPESERTGRPRDILGVLLGSNMSLGTVLFGWLPVSMGLGFWASVSAMAIGTLIGTALVTPLSLISMRTATNLSTSSGATFGVRGRLVGSAIGLLLALGYTALIIWTGGGIVVVLLNRMAGIPDGAATYSVVYLVMAALTILVAVVGYHWVVRLNRWIVVGTVAMMILAVVAYARAFTAAPIVDEYAGGDFWPTWALAVVVVGIGGPISYITVLGDYTRYMSPRTTSSRSVFTATALGLFVGLFVPQLFGTFTALATRATDDYVTSLVAAAPVWLLIPLALSGLIGTLGNSSMLAYDMGLDLDAIVPSLRRTVATSIVAGLATVLVFLGHFVWDAQDAITAFVLMLTTLGTPWAVITLMGHARVRGHYDLDALQIYNRRSRGGIYWYRGGWSVQATAAWVIGAAIGLLGIDTSLFRGPLLDYTGGIDLSFLLAAVASGVAFRLLSAPAPAAPSRNRLIRSATTTTGSAGVARGMVGKTDASAMDSPSTPITDPS
jgi:purine-cytosine permease-like protein